MSYVLFTPETRNQGMVRPTMRPSVRAIGRIAQPLQVGYSLLRTNGTWERKAVPTTDASLAVDIDTDGTVLFLRGGHWHRIRTEIYNEIVAAGFGGTIDAEITSGYPGAYPGSYPTSGDGSPSAQSHLPGDTLFPGDDLYPGEP